jgi:DNA-binding response OmpR family regulator
VRGQLVAAAAALARDVDIVPLALEHPTADDLDAIVVLGAPIARDGEAVETRSRDAGGRLPLVIALAPDGSTGEHVRLLGHDADVVLSANTHGRVVLATVLALLRWRTP